jgi:hypothetical protein
MSEVNQYMFKYPEIAAALVKQAGLHEGKWQIIMTFGLVSVRKHFESFESFVI